MSHSTSSLANSRTAWGSREPAPATFPLGRTIHSAEAQKRRSSRLSTSCSGASSNSITWTSACLTSSRRVWYMKTPPPCTGGQIGYGETNRTRRDWARHPWVRSGRENSRPGDAGRLRYRRCGRGFALCGGSSGRAEAGGRRATRRPDSGVPGVGGGYAEDGACPGEQEMRKQTPRLVDIFPREQQIILLQDRLNPVFAKVLADGAAVLVVDDAARLVEHLPAAFPGLVSQVGVFQVKGRQQGVETA